jgi:hypothetical protein
MCVVASAMCVNADQASSRPLCMPMLPVYLEHMQQHTNLCHLSKDTAFLSVYCCDELLD